MDGTIATGKWPCRLALSPDGKTPIYALQAPLGGKLLSLTLSSDGLYAYSSAQEQDKIFVVSLAERKIARVINTPKGSGPDPAIPLR